MVRSGLLVSGAFSGLALFASSPVNGQVQGHSVDSSQSTYVPKERDGEARILHYDTSTQGPEDLGTVSRNASSESPTASAADDGPFTPYTLTPRIDSGRTWMKVVGGYDSAVNDFRSRASAESAVTRWLALRVDFEHGPTIGAEDRVGVGARFQLLDQKRHGIDGGAVLAYQPNDFRREGNVVGGLLLGRRFGPVDLLGSALVGSDPEGDDQEIDGRVAGQITLSRILRLGLDNRFRTVLTDDAKRNGTTTTDWELAALPNASVVLGPVVILAEAGVSAIQQTSLAGQPEQRKHVRSGLLAMAGAGTAF